MSEITHSTSSMDLRRFRFRILLVRLWRWIAIGTSVGIVTAIIELFGDRLDLWSVTFPVVAATITFCAVLSVVAALIERYSDSQIAASIDHRAQLQDRLTTVIAGRSAPANYEPAFLDAINVDTSSHLASINPVKLYPIRFQSVHLLMVVLLIAFAVLYTGLDTTTFLSPTAKSDAIQLQHAADQVQRVAKPLLDQAEQPGATGEDKKMASDIRRFIHDLSRGQLSKQEALIRANQLSEQAQALEKQHSLSLSQSLISAQTAGQRLQEMANNASTQQGADNKLAQRASEVQNQVASLQNLLNASRSGTNSLSQSQRSDIEKKLASLQHQLQQIQISQQAQQMLEELQATPQYQQAMDLLSKLQQAASSSASGSSAQLSPQQMQQMANQLDQLAKQLNTQAKLREYAQQLLAAAKAARAGDMIGLSAGLDAAFGLNTNEYAGAPNDYGDNGFGSTSPGTWVGDHGKLNRSDKSTLLHLQFENHYVSSQQGSNGSETYTEELGPARLDSTSGIPYQAMLPKYVRSEESALTKGDIPLEMQSRVRDYFDSLHSNQ